MRAVLLALVLLALAPQSVWGRRCIFYQNPWDCELPSHSCLWSHQTQACVPLHTNAECAAREQKSDAVEVHGTNVRESVCEQDEACEYNAHTHACLQDRARACPLFLSRDSCATHPGCTWVGAFRRCVAHGRSSERTLCFLVALDRLECDHAYAQDCVWDAVANACSVRPTQDFVPGSWFEWCMANPDSPGCFGDQPWPDYACPRIRAKDACTGNPMCRAQGGGGCASKLKEQGGTSPMWLAWIVVVCVMVAWACCCIGTLFKA